MVIITITVDLLLPSKFVIILKIKTTTKNAFKALNLLFFSYCGFQKFVRSSDTFFPLLSKYSW